MRGAAAAVPPLLLLAAFLLPRGPVRAGESGDADLHLGAGSCAAQACHGGLAGSTEAWRRAYKVWIDEDRHAKAYASLSGDRGRRIGERLGIRPHEAAECVACHGTARELRNPKFDVEDGVSCELCHGAASGWLGKHTEPGWTKEQPSSKAAFGFRDLRAPAARAAACVGCHVGGEGNEITHAMMAAGHPPLGFDGSYFDRMPPHWEDDDPDAVRFETWLAAARADARAHLERAARQAAAGWPDFAAFDCYACHHAPYAGAPYGASGGPGDLPLDLAGLDVVGAAAGAARPGALRLAWTPGSDPRAFADRARRAIPEAERFAVAPADRATLRRSLDAWLARIEEGEAAATRTALERARGAVQALTAVPAPGPGPFRDALDRLEGALAEDRPFDPRAWATLARAALAAGG